MIGVGFSLFNIFYFKEPVITVISLLWIWVILMQLSESLAWKSQPENLNEDPNIKNKISAYSALIFNLTQPIILAFGLLLITNVSMQFKVLGVSIAMLYICWVIYSLNISPEFNKLTPSSSSCKHLDLYWWSQLPLSSIIYVFAMFSIILLLLRPFSLAVFEVGYIALALLISSTIYTCGAGSMWCWLVAFAPLATGIYWYFYTKHRNNEIDICF